MEKLQQILNLIGFDLKDAKFSIPEIIEKKCIACRNQTTPHEAMLDCNHQVCTNCCDYLADNWQGDYRILFQCPICKKNTKDIIFTENK